MHQERRKGLNSIMNCIDVSIIQRLDDSIKKSKEKLITAASNGSLKTNSKNNEN